MGANAYPPGHRATAMAQFRARARYYNMPIVYNGDMGIDMGILIPAALGLLALAIPIIIFYMLKQRRMEMVVSSSLLWRQALLDRTANAPWRRPLRNLLLILQLVLLGLLVLALARPFFNTEAIATGNMVVVLDASASMQATDEEGGISRFERAKQEAGRLVDSLQGGQRMSLIWAGPSALVVASASGNKGALHGALRNLSASNGRADIGSALTLAAASARQMGDATVVLISDGAFDAGAGLPQVPGRALYLNVGRSGHNVGITLLSLRDALGGGGPQLFAGLFNSGSEPATALLTIRVDGQLRDSRRVSLPPREEQTVTLADLPLDTHLVEATLSVEGEGADLLAADNRAWALRSGREPANVLLVTEGNGFLEKALNLIPNVRLFKTAPTGYVPSDGFKLTVLDGFVPAQLPTGNLLIFEPPDSALVPVSGTIAYPTVGQVAVNDPLMRYVDLSNTHIASAQRISTPPWSRVLARTATGEPLILAGEPDGRRVVVVAFDLHKSDLPLQISFPIFIANAVEWLSPPASVDAPPQLAPGEPVSIRPLPEAEQIVVTLPGGGGQQVALQPSEQVSFAQTDRPGVYTVQQMAKGKPLGQAEQFVVNLFSREESDITPQPSLAFSGTEATQAQAGSKRPMEIWPWVVLAALVLLTVEWWYYNWAGLRPGAAKRGLRRLSNAQSGEPRMRRPT